jgi:hypothetical protein
MMIKNLENINVAEVLAEFLYPKDLSLQASEGDDFSS